MKRCAFLLLVPAVLAAATFPVPLCRADDEEEGKQFYYLAVQKVKWEWTEYATEEEGAALEETSNLLVDRYKKLKPSPYQQRVQRKDGTTTDMILSNRWKPVKVSRDAEAKLLWIKYVSLNLELAEPTIAYKRGNAQHRQEYLARYTQWKEAHPKWNIGPHYSTR